MTINKNAEVAPTRFYRTLFYLSVAFLLANVTSAILFIALVNRPVYDDGVNLYDVHQYAARGLSLDSLRAQRNTPGPTSFLWMAGAARLLGGNELRAARIGALVSWVLLAIALLSGARLTRTPELWYAALLTLLVFPHAVEAACTVLTEGPALLFALLGALAWIIYVEKGEATTVSLLGVMAAGLLLGISVTCRQYNLALLPAAALVAVAQLRLHEAPLGTRMRWITGALVALCVAAVPVLVLVLAWKGITNPSIESGAAYNGAYQAGAGLNLLRPVIALFCTSFYLLWLTFPLMLRVRSSRRWIFLALSAVFGIAAGYWHKSLLQPGPLNTVVHLMARVLHGPAIPLALVALLAAYNLMALIVTVWEQKDRVLETPLILFSVLGVLLFVGEQFGVGGNIPFYDRYVLQVAPFLGVIAFAVLPSVGRFRLLALLTLSFFSHLVVWRNAFPH